eukprot:jgi/Chrpa1/9714/Chrysochromulina_OHIO_Genome00019972-RA
MQVLRDDPLRLVRALRFSASLGFRVHPSFWRAVPFAVEALRAKVSGPRKVTELRKIAKASRAALLDFFELAFEPLAAFGDDVAFGDALFGGPSVDPRRLSVAVGFDTARMRAAAATLPPDMEPDAALGAVLAAALISSDLTPCDSNGAAGAQSDDDALKTTLEAMAIAEAEVEDAARAGMTAAADDEPCPVRMRELNDAEMAAVATLCLREARRACDGLCASNAMRQAAVEPLSILVRLLQPGTPVGHHFLLAAASGVSLERPLVASAAAFASLVRMWEVLKLDQGEAQRQLAVGADYVLALGASRASSATSTRLREQLQLLRTAGPTISGSAVAGVPGLPAHLRGLFISMLHVFCRLRAEAVDLSTPEALLGYLDETCEGLLDQLRAEWWQDGVWQTGADGRKPRLREAYTKDATLAWQRAGVVLEN